MNKWFSTVIVILLLLSLSACRSTDKPEQQLSSEAETTVTATSTETTAEMTQPTEVETAPSNPIQESTSSTEMPTTQATEPPASVPCAHDQHKVTGAKASSCSEEGYSGDTVCLDCGAVLEQGSAIPESAHTEELVGKLDPTYDAAGYSGDIVCTVCNTTITAGYILPQLDMNQPTEVSCTHIKTITTGAKNASCTTEGYSGDALCMNCGATIRTGSAIPKTPHIEKTVGKLAATCTAEGYSGDLVCQDCGIALNKGSTIPMIPHTEKLVYQQSATYDAPGYSGDTVCAVCQTMLQSGTVIPQLTLATIVPKGICSCISEFQNYKDHLSLVETIPTAYVLDVIMEDLEWTGGTETTNYRSYASISEQKARDKASKVFVDIPETVWEELKDYDTGLALSVKWENGYYNFQSGVYGGGEGFMQDSIISCAYISEGIFDVIFHIEQGYYDYDTNDSGEKVIKDEDFYRVRYQCPGLTSEHILKLTQISIEYPYGTIYKDAVGSDYQGLTEAKILSVSLLPSNEVE